MGINIALVGNPNCGKTTMFNNLTGANQYVGNWPGVTVERKSGKYTKNKEVTISDLPGIYSLSPYSPEEVVARDFLLSGEPDAVINLVDATNLERNLYLTTQVLDLGLPVVVALNMMDLVAKNGDQINVQKLSEQLGCPVVETSAVKGEGMPALMDAVTKAAESGTVAAPKISFSDEIEEAVRQVQTSIKGLAPEKTLRWHAIKLLECEERTLAALSLPAEATESIDGIRSALEEAQDDDAESIITTARYDSITDLTGAVAKKSAKGVSMTEKIDRVVTNRFLGLPIFIVVMFLVYYLAVSTIGTLGTDWANDGLFGDGWLYTGTEQYDAAVEAFEENAAAIEAGELPESKAMEEPDPADFGFYVPGVPVFVEQALDSMGCADWLKSLILDGIVAGVGSVLGFVPQMIVLFLLLSILEMCGYMSRVAFIMDRIFRKFGLSGKSFIPMLIGSGCGVPAVMSTKTIENEKDRRMTIMTTTMIPCGAKLPIIALVFGAIAGGDPAETWWVAPMFYFMGVAAIVISGIMLKKLKAFAGEATPFVMELPSYHIPSVKGVLLATWERVRAFIVKAGTIIFLASVVIWFLMNLGFVDGQFGFLDTEMESYIDYSLMAAIGNLFAWIFTPLGFGNWQSTVAAISGLVAKENVVATVGVLTNVGEIAETDPTIWQAFGMMLGGSVPAMMAYCAFNLLCAPCFAAIGAISEQMKSAKWTWAAIGYLCGFAYVVAMIVYNFGMLLMFGTVTVWTGVSAVLLALMLFQLLRPMPNYEETEKTPVVPTKTPAMD